MSKEKKLTIVEIDDQLYAHEKAIRLRRVEIDKLQHQRLHLVQEDCTHTNTVAGRWVKNGLFDDDGWPEEDYEEEYEQPSTVDLDLHRYQCTRCKKIFHY